VTTRALVLAASLVAATASIAPAAVPVVPTLPTSALHAGQHAIVRTVFAGDSVETFEAEILGVMAGGRADGEYILARATSPRVEACGVAAGMSGSPVYVDGKLIGALSMGWPFSREPIFGITPIGEMLTVLDEPESAHPDGTAGPAGTDPGFTGERYRGLSWSDDTVATQPAGPVPGRPRTLPLPLAAGGLSPEAFEVARGLFANSGFLLTPGGRARSTAPVKPDAMEPGSAVAVDVLRGDLNFSAIGTVTYRDGDRILIFGHPFFQSGEVRLPLSTANIVSILPSLYDSFKLGTPGTPVGVATQDRRPAVGGHIGGAPRLMPFSVEVRREGLAPQKFHFESIVDRTMLSQLVGAAAMSSLMESGGGGAQQTVRWNLTVWRDGRSFDFGDLAAGDMPFADVAGAISSPLRFLTNNAYQRWVPDSLRVTYDVLPGRRQWIVRGASIDAATVRPGSRARVRVELERWRGERRTIQLDVAMPEEMPNGRYLIWIGGGSEYDRSAALRLPGRYRPTSLEDGIHRMQALRHSDAIYAALWARAPEVTRDGEDYPELPVSALAVLAPTQSAGERVRRGDWALMSLQSQGMDGVVRGEVALDVIVDDRAP
jgi:hypothetical protein